MTVPLQPFGLVIEEGAGETTFETSIVLNGINLPSGSFNVLAGQTLIFPVNPEIGYIDGSIYVKHAHHPFDIFRILFGSIVENALEVELEGNLNLQYEGLSDFADAHWVCRTHLSRSSGELPPDN